MTGPHGGIYSASRDAPYLRVIGTADKSPAAIFSSPRFDVTGYYDQLCPNGAVAVMGCDQSSPNGAIPDPRRAS
jgi:hypothetical protein